MNWPISFYNKLILVGVEIWNITSNTHLPTKLNTATPSIAQVVP